MWSDQTKAKHKRLTIIPFTAAPAKLSVMNKPKRFLVITQLPVRKTKINIRFLGEKSENAAYFVCTRFQITIIYG